MEAQPNVPSVEVSTFRLYVLRALYLLLTVGLALMIGPGLVHHPSDLPLMKGVVRSVLAAIGLLALLGLRYPLKMLPLLFYELVWKTIWILVFGLPLWLGHRLDADAHDTMKACLMGVVLVVLALPWRYVYVEYVRRAGDRWRRRGAG